MRKNEPDYRYNTVMLIDDSEMDNFVNERMLTAAGFSKTILVATNGEVAIGMLSSLITSSQPNDNRLPDVIFIDLNMPVVNGFEFIEQFKSMQSPLTEKCRLVILTSSIHNEDQARVEKLADNVTFLNKPIKREFLNNF